MSLGRSAFVRRNEIFIAPSSGRTDPQQQPDDRQPLNDQSARSIEIQGRLIETVQSSCQEILGGKTTRWGDFKGSSQGNRL
ncbi:hypothetical protein KR100_05095 [Synechococcus sp. KORDI-100]|nr:hypothetical protein KR100_05095 [Synechococcus sp. KORDI-100]